MLSVRTRRTRAHVGSSQQGNLADDDAQLSISQYSLTAHWQESNSLDNIRLTPFSGSYRKDQIAKSWYTPDMSRFPIHANTPDSSPYDRDLHFPDSTLREMTRKLLGHADVPNSKDLRNRDIDLDFEESVDRYSTRSITRSSRSLCKIIQGERCTHPECAITETASRVSAVERQRNTNNTSDAVGSLNTSEASHPGRPRRSRRVGGGARISSDAALTPTTNTRATNVSHTRTTESVVPNYDDTSLSSRLASTSSSYVYTYATDTGNRTETKLSSEWFVNGDGPGPERTPHWGRRSVDNSANHNTSNRGQHVSSHRFDSLGGQSNSNVKQRSWVSRHIFGLEEPDSENNDFHFVSSDGEDEDRITDSRSSRYRKVERRTVDPQDRHYFRPDTTAFPMRTSSRPLAYWVKRIAGSCLTLLLTALSYGYRTLCQSVSATTSFVRHLSPKVFGAPDSPPKGKPALHPRLAQFDTQNVSNLTGEEEQYDFLSQSVRTTAVGLSRLGYCCFRLIGLLCFLVPVGLLLAFLFAPVALDEDEAPPLLPPFLSDLDCKRAIFDTLSANASLMEVAYWRFRCLYQLYFLTPAPSADSNDNGGAEVGKDVNTSESQLAWRRWFPWFMQPTSDIADTSQGLSLRAWDSAEEMRSDRLSEFARDINNRLDLLAKALQHTDDRLSAVELHSKTGMNDLFMQLQMLTSQFTLHNISFEDSHIHTHPPSDQKYVNYDQLLSAVLEAANRSISAQLTLLFNSLKPTELVARQEFNGTISRLSILLSQVRQHLMYRSRRTEEELSRLRLVIQRSSDDQSANYTNLFTLMQNLQDAYRNLSDRINVLEKADLEADFLIKQLMETSRRCTEGMLDQVEHCKLVAAQSAETAFIKLSNTLTLQIRDLVHEALFQKLNDTAVDSTLRSKLESLVQQLSENAVRKALHGSTSIHGTTTFDSVTGDSVLLQKIVDASLQRFAADRTGMTDFALESAGGAIVGTRCTRTYTDGAALFRVFGIPLARLSNSPRTILQPGNNPGDCWPFHGSSGQAIIRLSAPIIVTGVSLEHLPKSLAPNGRLDSAPKDFQLKGLKSEHDEEGIVIGSFVYDVDGPPIQTFPIENTSNVWQFVELAILSNHGHPAYTCVYRIRVHGVVPDLQSSLTNS
ncbi:unnamed protein product [Dicrocoelium dendriticum]|nr:unnamed protein product [Dicrocoelium dendriticum]